MELHDHLRILRRRWLSVLMITAAVTSAAAGLTAIQAPQYASSARLFISTAQTDDNQLLQGGQFSAQRVKSYADLITSRELAKRVIEDTGSVLSPEIMAEKVEADAVVETVNLDLTVTDGDPNEAQLIAQSYAEQLRDLVRELETPTGEAEAPIKATIVDTASYSEDPVSPRLERNIGIGLVVGLVIGLGAAVLREALDTRVTSLSDVDEITDVPTLGTIVFDQDASKTPLLTDIPSHAPRAESFRVLRTNLQFVDVDSSSKVFVVTSAVPGEGKTSTAINLAIMLASAGTKTLLIEGDLRRPAAALRLGMDNEVGVTGILVGKVNAREAVQRHQKSGLDVIASGAIPPNPAELLQSQAMGEFLSYVRATYQIVIIDAPPLLPVTDAALLSAHADGALVVLSHGKVTKDQVRLSIERLEQVGARIAGIVLNKVPAKGKSYGYGYGYGYGYSQSDGKSNTVPRRPKGRRVKPNNGHTWGDS